MKQLYGVIGDPIGHSVSPAMQNDAFQSLGIDADYHAFHVRGEDLETAVAGMKAIGVAGFNITVPHKTAVMPLLDEITPLAQAIGAVNTVVRDGDKWIGYNTDGEGFLAGLQADYSGDVLSGRILLIGAGGAARAIYYTLAQKGAAAIDITNRTANKAEDLKKRCPYPVETAVLTRAQAEQNMPRYDIVIQTTSIGMSPNSSEQPIDLTGLKPGTFVADIVYNPPETKLMKQAAGLGARTQNGAKMLAYQGALAFEKWTGVMPDAARMEHIILEKTGGASC